MTQKKKLHYAWIVLLGVILIRGFAVGGINMTSGLFLAPVSDEIGVGIGTLSLYLSISSIFMLIWLPIAGKLMNKYDVRWMTLIGVVLQAGSFMLFGLMNSVWGWYILAIPSVMGATLVVNLLGPILINRWFAKHTGFMMGILMACVGLFGAALQPLTTKIIASSGWRTAYMVIGGITFIAVLISVIFFIKGYPKDRNAEPYGAGEVAIENKDKASKTYLNIEEGVATKSSAFFLLLLFMVAITGVGVFSQHIPTFGNELGYSIESVGMALALFSIGSAMGSIAIGIISDKIGCLKTSMGMIGVGVVAVALFFIRHKSFIIFSLAAFLHGFTSSGIGVLAPVLTLEFFGQKDYEKIFAKVMMGAPLASIILIPAYGFIYDQFKNYDIVLIGLLILLVVAFFSIGLGWKQRCKLTGVC